ncbi:hypothetical protein BURMUCGD1_2259 [Burkholderia multivorans CGD1]|nr:hypothetical protein BURMUCGD1_2259 [Burkholderia multivorans CGD1]
MSTPNAMAGHRSDASNSTTNLACGAQCSKSLHPVACEFTSGQ